MRCMTNKRLSDACTRGVLDRLAEELPVRGSAVFREGNPSDQGEEADPLQLELQNR